MLALACTGAHGRAAAIACETSGLHRGLRSLDGGLVVLGRRLRMGVYGEGIGEVVVDEQMGWFRPWMGKLRKRALRVFEADIFE